LEYAMPPLSDLEMAFRLHYASYGLIGYTMKIIRGAARIARFHPRRQITLHTLSQSFAEHVWAERLGKPISHCNLKFPHKCELTGGGIKGSWNTPCE
jgi:hypothetical protein